MAKAQADISTIKWDNLNRVLNEFADFFIQRARDYLAGNGSYATGNLGDTMQKIIEIEGTHFSVSIELASYWEYVNDGRKPGKFPPPYRIQEWISVKPITPYALPNGIFIFVFTLSGQHYSKTIASSQHPKNRTAQQLGLFLAWRTGDAGGFSHNLSCISCPTCFNQRQAAVYSELKVAALVSWLNTSPYLKMRNIPVATLPLGVVHPPAISNGAPTV